MYGWTAHSVCLSCPGGPGRLGAYLACFPKLLLTDQGALNVAHVEQLGAELLAGRDSHLCSLYSKHSSDVLRNLETYSVCCMVVSALHRVSVQALAGQGLQGQPLSLTLCVICGATRLRPCSAVAAEGQSGEGCTALLC